MDDISMRYFLTILLLLIALPVFGQADYGAYDLYFFVSWSSGSNDKDGTSVATAFETGDYATDVVPNNCDVAIFFESTDYYEEIDFDQTAFSAESRCYLIGDVDDVYWTTAYTYPKIHQEGRTYAMLGGSAKPYYTIKWFELTDADAGTNNMFRDVADNITVDDSVINVTNCTYGIRIFGAGFNLKNSTVEGTYGTNAMYIRDVDNQVIESNTFDCSGAGNQIFLRGDVNPITIRWNDMSIGAGGGIQAYTTSEQADIYANYFHDGGNYNIESLGAGFAINNNTFRNGNVAVYSGAGGYDFYNNIVENYTSGVTNSAGEVSINAAYNIMSDVGTQWFDVTDYEEAIEADVGFVAETGWEITESSPAFDAGVYWSPAHLLTDIEGNRRLRNIAIDIGAFEVQTGPTPFNLGFNYWDSQTELQCWDISGAIVERWTSETHEGEYACKIIATTSGETWLSQSTPDISPSRANVEGWFLGTGGNGARVEVWCPSTDQWTNYTSGNSWSTATIYDYRMAGTDDEMRIRVNFDSQSDDWIVVDDLSFDEWVSPYCATPMELSDVTDMRINTTRSSVSSGWKYDIAPTGIGENYRGLIRDNQNTFIDNVSGDATEMRLKIYPLNDTYSVQTGDWIGLTDSSGNFHYIYPPVTTITSETIYYLGEDGATYNDIWCCDVAEAAPTPFGVVSPPPTPAPSPTPSVTPSAPPTATPTARVITPTPTPSITPTPEGYKTPTPTPTSSPTPDGYKTPTPTPTPAPTAKVITPTPTPSPADIKYRDLTASTTMYIHWSGGGASPWGPYSPTADWQYISSSPKSIQGSHVSCGDRLSSCLNISTS